MNFNPYSFWFSNAKIQRENPLFLHIDSSSKITACNRLENSFKAAVFRPKFLHSTILALIGFLGFFGTIGKGLADVIYIDASLLNTNIATGGADNLWADGDDGTTGGISFDGDANADGLWRFRSAFGGNGIWEATGTSAQAEDCVELEVSVLVPNASYNVYVLYYAVGNNGSHPIRAGLESLPNQNQAFTRQTGLDSASLTFETDPPQDSSRTLLYGLVGQKTVVDGILRVFIDDFPAVNTGSSNERTWFAGIGYEESTEAPTPIVPDQVTGDLIAVDSDACWTWYTDERAIIDGNLLIAGGVRGKNWFGKVGDIMCTQFDLLTGKRTPFVLGPPPIKDPSNQGSGDSSEDLDDHNTAAFIAMPDGHYITAWSSHSENNEILIRRSSQPGDATQWDATQIYERSVADGANGPNDVTYNNLIYLTDEGTGQGRLFNFFRNDLADSWDRWFIYSDDLGVSWNWGGRHTGMDDASIRPYPKYATNGVDTIWWITSETAGGENIYSGFIKDGQNHQMDGTVIDPNIYDNTAFENDEYTEVMLSGFIDEGDTMTDLWPRDLEYDSQGRLAAVWRGNANGSSTDVRQYYGRWDFDDNSWAVNRMCRTGNFRAALQQDGVSWSRGTPLSAINPSNVDVCFFSGNADPETGVVFNSSADGRPNMEVFRAETSDGGATWNYTQLTHDSSCNNFRLSVIPWDDKNTAVMWMRGYYDRWFFNASNDGWDSVMVAYLERDGETYGQLNYTDAAPDNTSLADGTTLTTTTGTAPGADDDEWHLRNNQSFGNGATMLTANESFPYSEDVPMLKTTVTDVAAGLHDVYVCFWSSSSSDHDIMAGLEPDALMHFERQGSQHVTSEEFSSSVLVDDGANFLYRAYVGRVELNSPGEVEVFIDTLTSSEDSSSNQTRYDGIALKQVFTEPNFAEEFRITSLNFQATTASVEWTSEPNTTYRVTGSLTLLDGFPFIIGSDIPSEGALTNGTFNLPPEFIESPKVFLRIEKQ